jgi:hypothetical protein
MNHTSNYKRQMLGCCPQGSEGAHFIRSAVRWMNSRPESDNENLTPIQLLNEYANHLNQ